MSTDIANAKEWLLAEIPKYAKAIVDKKAKLSKKKNAQRALAEIHSALLALDLGAKKFSPPLAQQPSMPGPIVG